MKKKSMVIRNSEGSSANDSRNLFQIQKKQTIFSILHFFHSFFVAFFGKNEPRHCFSSVFLSLSLIPSHQLIEEGERGLYGIRTADNDGEKEAPHKNCNWPKEKERKKKKNRVAKVKKEGTLLDNHPR